MTGESKLYQLINLVHGISNTKAEDMPVAYKLNSDWAETAARTTTGMECEGRYRDETMCNGLNLFDKSVCKL